MEEQNHSETEILYLKVVLSATYPSSQEMIGEAIDNLFQMNRKKWN